MGSLHLLTCVHSWALGDCIAGLTVGIIVIPQSMRYRLPGLYRSRARLTRLHLISATPESLPCQQNTVCTAHSLAVSFMPCLPRQKTLQLDPCVELCAVLLGANPPLLAGRRHVARSQQSHRASARGYRRLHRARDCDSPSFHLRFHCSRYRTTAARMARRIYPRACCLWFHVRIS